ncbi:hypothetical protein [Castellaniella sp.]|uniref:hypothetical protein n=1 Tax=Castellaniella sp. TaxID=1955812 RepID=UPI002AFF654A|nr:hypothetical protein [Castellaniella sp.]
MNTNETKPRIDGSKTPETLVARINSEEWVGAGLQSKSRNDYARKISVLENKIHAEDKNGRPVSPARMARHLSELFERKEIAQATARAFKAAVLFWLAESAQALIGRGGEGLAEFEQAYQSVRGLATNELPKRTQQTSSPRLKALPKEVLETLQRYGDTTPGVIHVGPLLAFLKANLLVGLRPEEWFDAAPFTYVWPAGAGREPCLALRVKNSKHSHGRANGAYREILLYSINADDLAAILHFLEVIESHRAKNPRASKEDLAASFFGPLRNSMSNALTRTGYRVGAIARPTLYSSRHQAVANAKASGLSDREIAALFGHVSTSTAKSHYGKKLHGWMKTSFRPSPESLAAVTGRARTNDLASPDERMLKAASEWLRTPTK